MQTQIAEFLSNTPDGDEAERILRNCVHCGFCNATCPTYQLLGDELDGPRGRIYLIKQMVEGQPVTENTRLHLDRCLTCRNCETTCPSGVEYGRLAEIGRKHIEILAPRPAPQRMFRRALVGFMLSPRLFSASMTAARAVRPLLPQRLRDKVPPLPAPAARRARPAVPPVPTPRSPTRRMLLLAGCVQPSMLPNINDATTRVLALLGVQTVAATGAGCCGAIRLHMGYQDDALDDLRRNIDAWWPHIESGIETIITNASGCGATIAEYGHLLRNDAQYADKAARVSALARDISEVLADFEDELVRLQRVAALSASAASTQPRLAYHPPCTLQHGLRVRGKAEHLLDALGASVELPADSHLCCGSAGTYSIFQPELAYQLRDNKVAALDALTPDTIVSANVGCICHLQTGTPTPVMHWIEWVDATLRPAA